MMKKHFSLKLPKGGSRLIHAAMLGLMAIGLVMSGSAAMTSNVDLFQLLVAWLKQAGFLILGYVGYALLARNFSMDWFRKAFMWFMGLSLVALIVPLFFSEINGAKAWIPINLPGISFSIQPSEFVKIIVVLVLVVYLDVKKEKAALGELVRMPLFFVMATAVLVVIFQSDLGSGLVLLAMSVLVYLAATHPALKVSQWLMFGLMILALVSAGLLLTPGGLNFLHGLGIPDYMVSRFENTIDPFINRYGTGYQLVSSLMAFVKGKWLGVGFGKSLQKYGYLPAAQTDFILAVIAEEAGFLGVMAVAALTLLIAWRLLSFASKATDDASRMILSGVAYYILMHFILNVGGVTALIPLTGVPLLLISSGGSSTLSVLLALGIAQHQIVLMRNKGKTV